MRLRGQRLRERGGCLQRREPRQAFFDINNDKLFTDADKKSEGGKLVSAGSIRTTGMIGELNVKKVSSDQSTAQTCDTTGACKGLPNLNLRALTGRISWREIVTE